MRIILDFDYTLFNAKELREAIKAVFLRYGVEDEVFQKTYEESRGTRRDWHPMTQLEILKNHHGINKTAQIANAMQKTLAKSYIFLYEDTLPFLKSVAKSNQLALVTYGEDSFQNAKVDGCKIMKKYFDRIIITQNIYKDKEAADLAAGGRALFVEDNPAALAATKKLAPNIITVRMNRGMGRYTNEVSGREVDYEVKELMEVEKMILKLF